MPYHCAMAVTAEEQMEVFQASLSGLPLLRVVGDIDHGNSAAFEAAIEKPLELDGHRLLLDFSECPYIDGRGLSVLLLAAKHLLSDGWLGIVTNGKGVLRLFEIVGLQSSAGIRLFDDLDGAMKYLGEEPE
jgi:anti-anti-sigma factor